MSKLRTETTFADPDAAFRLIVEAHRGLDENASATLDTTLALLLANHLGDLDVLREAIEMAKRSAMIDGSQR